MTDECCNDHDHHPNQDRYGVIRKRSIAGRVIDFLQNAPRRIRFTLTADLPKAKLYSKRQQNASHHQPMEHPQWRDIAHAEHMRDDDPILGVRLDGSTWALPWWIMKNHHVANLTLNDRPILITLCEMCSGSSAFHAELNGRRLRFHPVGHYNGTIFTSDYETGSYWSPFTGQALSGPLKGKRLQRHPLVQCLWREWRTLHPDTLVPWGEQHLREGHGSAHSPGSPQIGPGFIKTLIRPMDRRLPHSTLVLGVESGELSRAYALELLDEQGAVLHDRLGEQEIVILHLPKTLHALAFSPELDGRRLQFHQNEAGLIVDQTTGSCWSFGGEAYEGLMKAKRLNFIESWIEEWYGWAAYHSNSDIFSVDRLDPNDHHD